MQGQQQQQQRDTSSRYEFADSRMECAFMSFQARKSAGTTSLAVCFLGAMWVAGIRVNTFQAPVPGRLLLMLALALLMVGVNTWVALYIRTHTRSTLEYLHHEWVKAWFVLFGAGVAMVCVLLQRRGEMTAASAPLCCITIHAWMALFYQLRIKTARVLHALLYLCFCIMLIGRAVLEQRDEPQLRISWVQLLLGMLTAVAAPLAVSGVLEAGCRAAFLRDLKTRIKARAPPPDLGPAWGRVLPMLGSQRGLMRAAVVFLGI